MSPLIVENKQNKMKNSKMSGDTFENTSRIKILIPFLYSIFLMVLKFEIFLSATSYTLIDYNYVRNLRMDNFMLAD